MYNHTAQGIPCTLSRPLTQNDARRFGQAISDLVWRLASTMTDDDRARAKQLRELREGHTSTQPA